MKQNIITLPLHTKLNYFNSWNMSRFGRREKKKTGSGRTRAGNSEKLSDTNQARAWASRAKAGLGPKSEARAGL